MQSFSQPLRSPSRLGSAGGGGQDAQEIQRLKRELSQRDKQLEEQAATLADMDQSVKELTALMPGDGITPGGGRRGGELGDDDEQTAAQLRQLLREKNEKISLMTADFDSHRADFRSTLDSLEMASTETERVYEEQKRDLLAQISDLQSQTEALQQELSIGGSSKEDFEGVATQLKQLEELVAELEEGLEESRRGEAEARGEVEFLRGEVERGRSELKREREKAAALTQNGEGASTKELAQKDDEIRGLKAIIHNLSLSPSAAPAKSNGYVTDSDELKRLQEALEQSRLDKEDLEQEIEQLRRDTASTNGNGIGHAATYSHIRNESERTAMAPESGTPSRQRSGTVRASFAERARASGLSHNEVLADEVADVDGAADADDDGAGEGEEEEAVYCEMCESREHDTLECDRLSPQGPESPSPVKHVAAPISSPHQENHASPKADEDKWCALCEKDGHLAFDCPEEQY